MKWCLRPDRQRLETEWSTKTSAWRSCLASILSPGHGEKAQQIMLLMLDDPDNDITSLALGNITFYCAINTYPDNQPFTDNGVLNEAFKNRVRNTDNIIEKIHAINANSNISQTDIYFLLAFLGENFAYRYTLSQEEVIEAIQLHNKSSKIILALAGIIIILIAFFTGAFIMAAIGSIMGYFLGVKVLLPYKAKKQYRENKALRDETTITLSDQKLMLSCESGESRIPWTDLIQWKRNNNICLLYITSNLFHIIPLRALPSDHIVDMFFATLAKHNVKEL